VKKQKSKRSKARSTLYAGAKISNYQFKRVLMAFVMDEPVAVAASHIALSANSIQAIYRKLRTFFVELTVFEDIYLGGDPKNGLGDTDAATERLELDILGFHLARVKDKKLQMDTPRDQIDPHFAESCWRYQYHVMERERPGESITPMMFAHLHEIIKSCGPVGKSVPRALISRAYELKLAHLDQRVLWLSRNAPSLKSPSARTQIQEVMAIAPMRKNQKRV
jgi:hypothetical protein